MSLYLAAVALAAGAVYAVAWIRDLGLSVSLEGFLNLGGKMYGLLLQGEADPWWYRLSRMWIFPSVLLGGAAFPLVPSRRRRLLSLAGFVPSLLIGTAVASRFGTGLAIACWASGYLSSKCLVTRGRHSISVEFLVAVVLIGCLSVMLYTGLWLVRGHEFSGDMSDSSFMMRTDLLSYLPVFDNWVETRMTDELSLGAYTFAGAFELLGLRGRERAFDYDEIKLEAGIWSNYYTAFRGLIEDFSLPGSVILLFAAGMLVGQAYARVCDGTITSVWVLGAYYVYVLWSPIVSAFNYNSVLLAIAVIGLALRQENRTSGGNARVVRG